MNEEEIVAEIVEDISGVNIENLPSVLSSQFDKLNLLQYNVEKSLNMAIEAKIKSEDAHVKMGIFDWSKKDAIKLLQEASKGLAEGIMTAAEAQKVSFEYQTKLTEITKFLLRLGLSNIAMNRSVVRELELKLKGASEEEISDLAKQELKNVIMQLKAQEDIMNKQAKLTDKVKQQNKLIEFHSEKLFEQEKDLEEQQKKNTKFKQQISNNEDNINSIKKTVKQQEDELIEKNNALDKKYSDIIKQVNDELLEHKKCFGEQQKKNTKFKQQISNNEDNINNIKKIVKQQEDELIEKNNALDKKYSDIIKQVNDELSKLECSISSEINSFDKQLINTITDLKEGISNKDKEVYNKFIDLQNRVNSLDIITSKLGWKIGISIIAIGSLILNVLQICGII